MEEAMIQKGEFAGLCWLVLGMMLFMSSTFLQIINQHDPTYTTGIWLLVAANISLMLAVFQFKRAWNL